MRMNKIIFVFIIFFIALAIQIINPKVVKADIFSDAKSFREIGKNAFEENETDASDTRNAIRSSASSMFNILFAVGVAITVIVGGILGIQFMIASAEDKAKIKEALIPYIVGCVVIYGAFGIWKLVITILGGV